MRDLTRWNPISEFTSGLGEFDDLYDRFLGHPYRASQEVAQWRPTLESYTKDGKTFVRLDLPGIDPTDVDIVAENGFLTISGVRKGAKDVEEKNYHYRETSFGKFERRLILPKGTDTGQIAARYDKGVLEVSASLPIHLSPRKVEIQVDGGKSDPSQAA